MSERMKGEPTTLLVIRISDLPVRPPKVKKKRCSNCGARCWVAKATFDFEDMLHDDGKDTQYICRQCFRHDPTAYMENVNAIVMTVPTEEDITYVDAQ